MIFAGRPLLGRGAMVQNILHFYTFVSTVWGTDLVGHYQVWGFYMAWQVLSTPEYHLIDWNTWLQSAPFKGVIIRGVPYVLLPMLLLFDQRTQDSMYSRRHLSCNVFLCYLASLWIVMAKIKIDSYFRIHSCSNAELFSKGSLTFLSHNCGVTYNMWFGVMLHHDWCLHHPKHWLPFTLIHLWVM